MKGTVLTKNGLPNPELHVQLLRLISPQELLKNKGLKASALKECVPCLLELCSCVLHWDVPP